MKKIQEFVGVTLIELLTMLFVVVILTTISVPLFTNLIREFRVSSAAESLFYSVQYARSEAIKRNANVYISFSTGDNWCYGINQGSACDCTNPSSCGLGTTSAEAAQQLTMTTNLVGNSLYFEGSHGASNVVNGAITFTVYGQTSYIKVMITQLLVQMCSNDIGGYWSC